VSDRSIIFGTRSVAQVLAGTKTQARRYMPGLGRYLQLTVAPGSDMVTTALEYPNGVKPGDRMWVKEVWRAAELAGQRLICFVDGTCIELADDEHADSRWSGLGVDGPIGGWREPMWMPRWASRLEIHVQEIRVHRLQDIPHADLAAEGASSRAEFAQRWDAASSVPWVANPWIWAVTFERVERVERVG
jgi:hypothetical protein